MVASLEEVATILHMKSFPGHFHNGSDEQVRESEFSEDPKKALREFLPIVRAKFH